MSEQQTCCDISHSGNSYYGRACGKKAKVERDSKHYCLMHDPVRVKERRAAKNAEIEKKLAARQAVNDAAKAKQKEIERRAELFDEMLSSLVAAEDALRHLGGALHADRLSETIAKANGGAA